MEVNKMKTTTKEQLKEIALKLMDSILEPNSFIDNEATELINLVLYIYR